MKAKSNRVTPPLFGMGHLRRAHGYTLGQVVEGLYAITGRRYAEGTINAVELGLDRPGPKLAAALLEFYDVADAEFVYVNPRLVPPSPRQSEVA